MELNVLQNVETEIDQTMKNVTMEILIMMMAARAHAE
jgi:hypothetical protein